MDALSTTWQLTSTPHVLRGLGPSSRIHSSLLASDRLLSLDSPRLSGVIVPDASSSTVILCCTPMALAGSFDEASLLPFELAHAKLFGSLSPCRPIASIDVVCSICLLWDLLDTPERGWNAKDCGAWDRPVRPYVGAVAPLRDRWELPNSVGNMTDITGLTPDKHPHMIPRFISRTITTHTLAPFPERYEFCSLRCTRVTYKVYRMTDRKLRDNTSEAHLQCIQVTQLKRGISVQAAASAVAEDSRAV